MTLVEFGDESYQFSCEQCGSSTIEAIRHLSVVTQIDRVSKETDSSRVDVGQHTRDFIEIGLDRYQCSKCGTLILTSQGTPVQTSEDLFQSLKRTVGEPIVRQLTLDFASGSC